MTPASLMVCLTPGVPNDALLQFTADVAGRLEATRVIGIGACQPVQVYGSPDAYVPQSFIDWDQSQIDKELKDAEASLRSVLEGKVAILEWRSKVVTYGSIADFIAAQMRAADLLITAPESAGSFDAGRRVDIADLVLKAGRPMLVAATPVDKLDLGSVVVGWKDSREARRAVEDALPILKRADRVTVAGITSEAELAEAGAGVEDVADWLERHGIAATARAVASTGDDATQLSRVAEELNAGLLVGGAYGHTRLREWILGGVTRDLLLRPARCSFVSH